MINVLANWKLIVSRIFGSKEFQSAIDDETKTVISRKHAPILIFYSSTAESPRDCYCASGVRTNIYDKEHYQIDVWYGKDKNDYDYFMRKNRFDKMIIIPQDENNIKRVIRFNHVVMTKSIDIGWGNVVSYIGRQMEDGNE